jgi:hypothetical protein
MTHQLRFTSSDLAENVFIVDYLRVGQCERREAVCQTLTETFSRIGFER